MVQVVCLIAQGLKDLFAAHVVVVNIGSGRVLCEEVGCQK